MSSFPMRDLGGSGRTSAYSDRSADAPVGPLIILNQMLDTKRLFFFSFLEQGGFFWPFT